MARRARLDAERNGAAAVVYPDELVNSTNPDVAVVISSENKLFQARLAARNGQKAQLRQQIEQMKEEAEGLAAQQNAKSKEIELIQRELVGVKELFAKNLVQLNRLTQLERESARIEGERGQLIAAMAQSRVKTSETELKIIQIDQDGDALPGLGSKSGGEQPFEAKGRKLTRCDLFGDGSGERHGM